MGDASVSSNENEGPARWSLQRLFGGLKLSKVGGERIALPGKREPVLLACLATSPKFAGPRRTPATLLWGDAIDEGALDNLRPCVWSLREALGSAKRSAILRDGEDIALGTRCFDIDSLALTLPVVLEPDRRRHRRKCLCNRWHESTKFPDNGRGQFR